MIDKNKMDKITNWLIGNVFRNSSIMFNDAIRGWDACNDVDLVDIVASLHNLLYESVYGEPYDYMFHWANKVGSGCSDSIFEEMEEDDEKR